MYDSVQRAIGLPPQGGTEEAAGVGGRTAIVGVAASLGGLSALSRVLAGLPADFPLPVLVVQHLSPRAPGLLPGLLAGRTALRVEPAKEGDRPAPGTVYVAPPGHHLLVRADGALGLSDAGRENFCRPSADVLFRSLAGTFGPGAVAVVLTGLGVDGGRGVEAVVEAGGIALAQDEAGAEAPGMPCAAVDIGRADLILPLDRIAFALAVLAGKAAPHASGSGPTPSSPAIELGCRRAGPVQELL